MKKLLKIATPLAVAMVVAGHLAAQPGPPPPPPGGAPGPRVSLTPAEMGARAQLARDQVRADIQRMRHLQALARNQNDVVKLGCVNDKFIKLKAEANLFDVAHRHLITVLELEDRFTAYANVTKSAAEIRKFREEADGCVGQRELSRDAANLFTRPEYHDPTLYLPFDIEVEPPGYASPYTPRPRP